MPSSSCYKLRSRRVEYIKMQELDSKTAWAQAGRPLLGVYLPERRVRLATATAAAFNAVGMPVQLIILRNTPVPKWPEYVSIAFGAVLLGWILLGGLKGRPKIVSALF